METHWHKNIITTRSDVHTIIKNRIQSVSQKCLDSVTDYNAAKVNYKTVSFSSAYELN